MSRSGFKGVYPSHIKSRPWKATICIGGANRYLGLFKTAEEASAAFQAAFQQKVAEKERRASVLRAELERTRLERDTKRQDQRRRKAARLGGAEWMTRERLAWAHGPERADAIMDGRDPAANLDQALWRSLGERKAVA
jgi:uncharacterized small protein (DUF1192 family)